MPRQAIRVKPTHQSHGLLRGLLGKCQLAVVARRRTDGGNCLKCCIKLSSISIEDVDDIWCGDVIGDQKPVGSCWKDNIPWDLDRPIESKLRSLIGVIRAEHRDSGQQAES